MNYTSRVLLFTLDILWMAIKILKRERLAKDVDELDHPGLTVQPMYFYLEMNTAMNCCMSITT